MHPALLLDDVLRQILALCPTACLPAVARSCKDFRDPALDGIWLRLASIEPLLNLIPGLICVNGIYNVSLGGPLDLSIFYSYASRVKHINQRHDIRAHPALLAILSKPGTTVLNNLITTRLSSIDLHCIPAVLALSPSLRQLDVDFGFKKTGSTDGSTDYFENLLRVATDIQGLRLRGSVCQRLNSGISQMSNLRSLTLHTGTFLTGDTLVAISAFSRLSELDIEAGHLDVDGLTEAWPVPTPDVGYFRSLQKLRVCAQAPFLELLLKTIQPGSLRTLRIEATTPSGIESPVCWGSIFALIRANASQTLEDLTIEQHLEDIDIDTIPTTSPGTTQHTHPSTQPNTRITFDIIRLLAPLRRLRNLTFDMTRIPDLSDEDFDALSTWWPDLAHLDLGSLDSSECTPLTGSPRATPACLRAFAAMPMLDTLILPLSIGSAPLPPTSSASGALERATFSSSAPPPDPVTMAHYLYGLFPRLTEVEGTDQHEVEWGTVQSLLRGLQSSNS